ncbi:MAG TPA: hypothetical protein PLF23_04185 [Candidatus Obscuribacter sp.]|nr:hypothetical protein [Candidatus Obscuribacter sp.]
MTKRSSKILVGDLLVKSELVTLAQFADAMPVSLKTGLPVGRVLIASGFLDEEKFKQVLTVQSLIRDHLLSGEAGVEALKLIARDGCSLTQALSNLGETCDYFDSTNRLGEILAEAGIVDEAVLEDTLAVSITTGLPLARVLAMRGNIAEAVAYMALCAQCLIRDGKLDRETAIKAIKLVNENLDSLQSMGIKSRPGAISLRKANSLRLGELLLLSGMVDDKDIIAAVEEGLTDEQPLGKVLTRVGIISEVELGQALAIQEMINNRTLNPDDATYVLSSVKGSGMSLSKAISQTDKLKDGEEELASIDVFLAFLGLGVEADYKALKESCKQNQTSLLDRIKEEKRLDAKLAKPVFDCYELYRSGKLDDDQCAFAVHMMAASGQLDLADLLKRLNWQ